MYFNLIRKELKYQLFLQVTLALLFSFSPLFGHGLPEHASEEPEQSGLIILSAQQINDANIATAIAYPGVLQIGVATPAKIVINEERHAHVFVKALGATVKILKNVGDDVKAGDVLAILESKEMAEAKVAYLTALKRETVAARLLKAEQDLKDKKITSEQNYMQAALAGKEAKINVEAAKQQLYAFGLDEYELHKLSSDDINGLYKYEVKAPLDGVVIAKDLAIGERVDENKEIFTIADLNIVWVKLNIYPKDLTIIKLGKKINIRLNKDDSNASEAIITQLSPTIDEETRTASAIATLPNSQKNWLPGSYVYATVIVDEVKVPIAVLTEALHDIEGECCVFVYHAQGFEKKNVVTGKTDGKYTEILSGIAAGVSYATTNTFLLKAEHGKASADMD